MALDTLRGINVLVDVQLPLSIAAAPHKAGIYCIYLHMTYRMFKGPPPHELGVESRLQYVRLPGVSFVTFYL